MGAEGVRCIENGILHTVSGKRAEHLVDTIGAGDSHCAAILLGLCRGMSMKDALSMANRVSCAVVQTDGATLSDEDLFSLI